MYLVGWVTSSFPSHLWPCDLVSVVFSVCCRWLVWVRVCVCVLPSQPQRRPHWSFSPGLCESRHGLRKKRPPQLFNAGQLPNSELLCAIGWDNKASISPLHLTPCLPRCFSLPPVFFYLLCLVLVCVFLWGGVQSCQSRFLWREECCRPVVSLPPVPPTPALQNLRNLLSAGFLRAKISCSTGSESARSSPDTHSGLCCFLFVAAPA